jgi:manganese/iron transport system substrate-binding protein
MYLTINLLLLFLELLLVWGIMNSLFRVAWQKNLAITSLSLLTACTQPTVIPDQKPSPKPSSDKPQIVATTSIICDLVKTIAAGSIDLQCLIPTDQDPHLYQPTAANQQAIANAQIIFYSGHGLEENLLKTIQASTAKKVAVAEVAVSTPLKKDGAVNPHVWHNALYGIKMAEVIKNDLVEISPKNTAIYNKKYAAFDKELTSLHDWLKTQISTLEAKSRQLVTSHNSLAYYAVPYNIPVEGSVYGNSTAEKTTPERLKKVVDRIKQTKVKAVFAEMTVDNKAIEEVAKAANVKVAKGKLYTDGIGTVSSAAATYAQMMAYNTKIIVEGLGGKFTAFKPVKGGKNPNNN